MMNSRSMSTAGPAPTLINPASPMAPPSSIGATTTSIVLPPTLNVGHPSSSPGAPASPLVVTAPDGGTRLADAFKDDLQRALENVDLFHLKALLEVQEVLEFIRRPKFLWHDIPREIPLHNANFCPQILSLYLAHGANPDAVCEYVGHGPLQESFETLLGHAIRCNQPASVELLLQAGADTRALSWVGNVCGGAKDVARELGHKKLVRIIGEYEDGEKRKRRAEKKKKEEDKKPKAGTKPGNSDTLGRLFSSVRQASELHSASEEHRQRLSNLLEERTQPLMELRRIDSDIQEEEIRFKRRLVELGAGLDSETTEGLIAEVEDETVESLGRGLTNALGLELETAGSDQTNWEWDNNGEEQQARK